MLITIKYFGMLVEITNTTQESYQYDLEGISINDIELSILSKYPNLKNTTYNIAVNQQIATKNQPVKNGDELAFLPPFAGG